ncbi:unnamed protein product [Orchesella dallaii]|uniref:BZIP domain-containing protein n=1 Tax=Orchesella dallaii TaxID=48710 RepID=A0ABP1QRT1_9HEXA
MRNENRTNTIGRWSHDSFLIQPFSFQQQTIFYHFTLYVFNTNHFIRTLFSPLTTLTHIPDVLMDVELPVELPEYYYPEQYYSDYGNVIVKQETMSYTPNSNWNVPTTTSMLIPNSSQLKRKMTLDLNVAKRARPGGFNEELLTTADLNKVAISTPEMTEMLYRELQTPRAQPSGLAQDGSNASVFFPKNVTEEQEQYVKEFEKHLKQMHESGTNTTSSSFGEDESSSASSYNPKSGAYDFNNVIVKEEPQTVPDTDESDDDDDDIANTANMTPIDMANQEKIKLERKRQRNRLAASKCRKRKLERIARLEDKVNQLKSENAELGTVLLKLREQVGVLKNQVMEHVQAGCPIMVNTGSGNFN